MLVVNVSARSPAAPLIAVPAQQHAGQGHNVGSQCPSRDPLAHSLLDRRRRACQYAGHSWMSPTPLAVSFEISMNAGDTGTGRDIARMILRALKEFEALTSQLL